MRGRGGGRESRERESGRVKGEAGRGAAGAVEEAAGSGVWCEREKNSEKKNNRITRNIKTIA